MRRQLQVERASRKARLPVGHAQGGPARRSRELVRLRAGTSGLGPDGKRIAWGGPKPGVWSVASGKQEFPLAGHSAAVGKVEWSTDGRRLLSRCEVFGGFTPNYELKVWDIATQQELFMLRGPMAGWLVAPGFQALASPPGHGSDPGDVVVWVLAPRNE